MMRITLAGALLLASTAAIAQSAPSGLPVYDATQIALSRYSVIKRLWVGSWRSAISIPAYGDEQAARNALMREATRLGADGVINLFCVNQIDRPVRKAGYSCYGNAIKLKKQ